MEVKNLLGKLHSGEDGDRPKVPAPPTPQKPQVVENAAPVQVPVGGRQIMREELSEDGIILDLGEGISLNIPIQRRMSLSDFIKLAEKVKALEMLSESSERYGKEY